MFSHPLRRARSLFLYLAFLLAFCGAQYSLAHDDNGSKINAKLEGAPAGPNVANFTASATPITHGAALQMQWALPPGVDLLGGPPQNE